MALEIHVPTLCSAKPAEIATQLRKLAASSNTASVTANIDSLVASGILPARVYRRWLTVSHEGETIAAALRQTHSASVRNFAIKLFGKMLRSADGFAPAWGAVGGAQGLADLMVGYSVVEVKQLCIALGHTGSALRVREERQQRLTELALLLLGQQNPHDEPATEAGRPDPRPFGQFYEKIVPGCTNEMIMQWENRDHDWSRGVKTMLLRVHTSRYEEKFLNEIFSPKDTTVDFASGKHLFSRNMPLSERILTKLIESRGDARVPDDFLRSFAHPLLAYLFRRRRFDDQYRARIIGLIVECAERHEAVAEKLVVDTNGLFGLSLQLWNRARGQLNPVEGSLRALVKILPTEAIRNIQQVRQILERTKLELRYPLLRLIVQNAKRYGFDIDDPSEEGISRLKELPPDDPWPATMFTGVLDHESALPLFRRLMKANPSASFLGADSRSSPGTILKQTQSPENTHGDPEVLDCLLIRYSPNRRQEGLAWIRRAESIVDERRKKAAQARDWGVRAFWVKSALRLCAAAGLLKLYGETSIWARRFNKDPLAVKDIYGEGAAEEVKDLLCALPLLKGDDVSSAGADTLTKNIHCANQILMQLLETAGMAAVEPSFQVGDWRHVWGLSKEIIELRIKRVGKFQRKFEVTDYDAADIIWKPTIDTILQIDAMMQKPELDSVASKTVSWRRNLALQIIMRVADTGPPRLIAQLATFWLEGMRQKLKPAHMRQYLPNIILVIQRLGCSDQPSLACPFVRDFILNDEDNSAWHRSLINVGFLSTLPAKAAKEFLHTIADAIQEKMRKQNMQTPGTKGDGSSVPAPPIVKVTTVKMLAQILGDALFIDPASACDILIGLLTQARHIDIQTAIVESLLSILVDPTSSAALRNHIIDSLERSAVPIAAQLSARRTMTDDDWSKAVSPETLPEVDGDTSMPAVLSHIVDRATRSSLAEEDRSRLARLVMSVLDPSAENNSRWAKLFLKIYSLDLNPGFQLPATPVQSKMLGQLLTSLMPYMPRSVFEMLQSFILVNLNPPSSVARVTRAVKENRDLMNSNAGKHWLSLYDNPGANALKLGGYRCATALHTDVRRHKSKLSDGVTVNMLQSCVLEIAEALIAACDANSLDNLASNLLRNHRDNNENWDNWKTNTLPVLRQIVTKIESIRSEEWQRDSDRKPSVLPNSFRLRARILVFPYSANEKLRSPPKETNAFVTELSGLINRLAGRRLPYHEDWPYLKSTVAVQLRNPDFVPVALGLGYLDDIVTGEPVLGDYLRVELAGDLLIKAIDPRDQELATAVRSMVESWRSSEVESFRTVAIQVKTNLAKRIKGEKSWFSEASTAG